MDTAVNDFSMAILPVRLGGAIRAPSAYAARERDPAARRKRIDTPKA